MKEVIQVRTEKEITAIYERQADTVWRVCFSFMKNHHDAQDMLQETFIRLMRSDVRFQDAGHEKAWLIVTASNLCKNALRHPERIPEDIDGLWDLAAPERQDTGLAEAVLALPPLYQEAVYLYYYEGYGTEEIGKMLNITPSAVRSRLARARTMLKLELEEEDNEK